MPQDSTRAAEIYLSRSAMSCDSISTLNLFSNREMLISIAVYCFDSETEISKFPLSFFRVAIQCLHQ